MPQDVAFLVRNYRSVVHHGRQSLSFFKKMNEPFHIVWVEYGKIKALYIERRITIE